MAGRPDPPTKARVLDSRGVELAPCSLEKAEKLLAAGQATLVSHSPLTIELAYAVDLPEQAEPETKLPGEGKRLLLHVCCGPCATYPLKRLREVGFDVKAHWYNPNIHPFSEHQRRLECAAEYAQTEGIALQVQPGYEAVEFLRAVSGHERAGERCAICYRLRLARAAEVAREGGFDAYTTTLLISPYQDQDLVRRIGEEEGARAGVPFHFENLRRGWAERGAMAREHALYQQRYCGCLYSEWESLDRTASTGKRAHG